MPARPGKRNSVCCLSCVKSQITLLRSLLMGLNLSFAAGIPCTFFVALFGVKEDGKPPRIIEPQSSITSLPPKVSTDFSEVAAILAGRPEHGPAIQVDPIAASPPPAQEEGGPLGRSWRYIFYFLRQNPGESLVVLEKKEDELTAFTPPPRGAHRGTPTGGPNRLMLCVADGRFTDKRLGLDFLISSADTEKFIYALPDHPETKYCLRYQKPGRYLETGELIGTAGRLLSVPTPSSSTPVRGRSRP